MVDIESATTLFIKDIRAYFMHNPLSPTDEKQLSAMFARHSGNVAIIIYEEKIVTEVVEVPVYVRDSDDVPVYAKPEDIIAYVEAKCDIQNLLITPCRKRKYSDARKIAMYLLKRHTRLSLKEIGFMFFSKKHQKKGLDHTTIIHNLRAASDLLAEFPFYTSLVFNFTNSLNNDTHDRTNKGLSAGNAVVPG